MARLAASWLRRPPTHSNESIRVAKELFDAFNAHDLDRLEDLASDGFVGIRPDSPTIRTGPKGARSWASAYFSAFPDSKWTKERIFANGAAFVLQVIYTGTHMGTFGGDGGIQPTRKVVTVAATFVGIARNGKIEHMRGY